MLGDTGRLARVAAAATVFWESESSDWIVLSLDSSGDGGIYTTSFGGPNARERAIEYASEKYSGFRLRTPDPPKYR